MKHASKNRWQVQEAKTHLSELIEKVDTAGPQVITKHGKERAAVISIEDLKELQSVKEKKPNFIDHLLNGPKFTDEEVEFMFKRNPETGRAIDLSGIESNDAE